MEYMSVIQLAEKYGISERTARNYCAAGKIDGAFLTGKTNQNSRTFRRRKEIIWKHKLNH